MNPIAKALDEVKFKIPPSILNEVFREKGRYMYRNTPVSIDEQIRVKVIQPRVLVDCNLAGGAEVFVPVNKGSVQFVEDNAYVVRFPKTATQGRSILSVLSLSFLSPSGLGMSPGMYTNAFKPCSVTPVLMAGQDVANSFMPIPTVSTARVELIAENTILIRDSMASITDGYLRCILMNDENMSHLQLKAIPKFCHLVVLAVKSYIYNNYSVLIDEAYLSGGQELGKFKDIVDGYADAEELYQEYLSTKWGVISMLNDRESKTRFIKLMTGVGH